VVHESVPAKDLREFVALAKKEPGKLYYGSAGNGSARPATARRAISRSST